jgi:hypothetical protein
MREREKMIETISTYITEAQGLRAQLQQANAENERLQKQIYENCISREDAKRAVAMVKEDAIKEINSYCAENERLRTALALANSMLVSGERHTEESIHVIESALEAREC